MSATVAVIRWQKATAELDGGHPRNAFAAQSSKLPLIVIRFSLSLVTHQTSNTMAPIAVSPPANGVARPFKRRRNSASPSFFDALNPALAGATDNESASNQDGPTSKTSMGPPAAPTTAPAATPVLPSAIIQDDDEDDYVPYVPVAKRRANLLSSIGARHGANAAAIPEKREKTTEDIQREAEDRVRAIEEAEEKRREKSRKERTLLEEAQEVKRRKAEEGG